VTLRCFALLNKVVIRNSIPLLLFSAPAHIERPCEIVFLKWFLNVRTLFVLPLVTPGIMPDVPFVTTAVQSLILASLHAA
jgi:hypothetical protein